MRHDVLCAKYGFDSDPGQDKWGYEPPVRPCDCSRFAEVRRDALDAAREAVARLQHKPGASIANAVSAIDGLVRDYLASSQQNAYNNPQGGMEDDDYAYVAAQAEADGRWRGWTDALNAAREAVARQCGHTKSVSTNYECDHDRAIAAINALQDALQDDLSRYE